MLAEKIDKLMEILAALYPECTPSIANHRELYRLTDSIPQEDIAWDSFSKYEVWFRNPLIMLKNQLCNLDFKDEIDYAPKQIYYRGKHHYQNLIYISDSSRSTHGALFVPVILGSDKTTVSVATGQNDYYPLYISLSNVHNSVHCAHCNALSLLGFLAIPKMLLVCIVQNWCPKCTAAPNNLDTTSAIPQTHAHIDALVNTGGVKLQELWDDYGIVGDIIPFKMSFPRANIHELLFLDLLHQFIKGTYKDHLVKWVEMYIMENHVKAQADLILDTLDRFHEHCEVFHELSVVPDGFSLPCQHSISHYPFLITQFRAPNGVCSSITESKHKTAVKDAFHQSNQNKPMGQMLVTNQHIDKLAAACIDFASRGMLDGPSVVVSRVSPQPEQHNEELDEAGAVNDIVDEPESYSEISLVKMYASQIAQVELPPLLGKVFVYRSVHAVFYAPSDLSGLGGLHHECICSTPSWYDGPACRDCVFVGNTDLPDAPGMRGLLIACVHLFFSFIQDGTKYPCCYVSLMAVTAIRYTCALVHWFSIVGDMPCNKTGMWVVAPDFQGAHLIGIYGADLLPNDLEFTFDKSLDVFPSFYVNNYVDHHAHKIAF
ncbi:hypothetical protein EI94DRAFT_1774442 [Lactarius quietus]|nr:hypothetical protein EI94DRAFT_1774442 [Lactarius quietus]